MKRDRRQFLTATTGFGIAMASCGGIHAAEQMEKHDEAGVTASEDLMREHGVLNRILLIYEEGLRRLRGQKKDVSGEMFHTVATLVRNFIEDYHGRLEEKFIFPEFEKRNQLTELVTTLRQQHEAGRKLTDTILRGSEADQFGEDARRELGQACQAFIRMYRPHEAREDTVLFPALRRILPAEQIDKLGDQFEEQENKLFGEGGFEKAVAQVAAIEKQLGIYDLAQFTPQ